MFDGGKLIKLKYILNKIKDATFQQILTFFKVKLA